MEKASNDQFQEVDRVPRHLPAAAARTAGGAVPSTHPDPVEPDRGLEQRGDRDGRRPVQYEHRGWAHCQLWHVPRTGLLLAAHRLHHLKHGAAAAALVRDRDRGGRGEAAPPGRGRTAKRQGRLLDLSAPQSASRAARAAAADPAPPPRLVASTAPNAADAPATAGARPATPAAQPTAARHPCPKHVSAALTAAARLSFTSAAAVIAAVAAAVRGVQR